MSKYVPRIGKIHSSTIDDSDGSQLSEGSKHRAASGSSLQPDDEWYIGIALIEIGAHASKELIVHAAISFGSVPIDFLISCMCWLLPANAW